MKKLGLLLIPILAITLMLGGNAFAQNVGDNSFYFVTYYSNANTTGAPDQTVRIINDGDLATAYTGALFAAIYVFDDSQEMISCCSCYITQDGLLSESVNKELTSNTFTGRGELTRGVIKVVSAAINDPAYLIPGPGLRAWATHVQATTTTFPAPGPGNAVNAKEAGPWFVTETALSDSNLTELEASNLGTLCSYGLTIGSGYGACPCTLEDYDF
jgi:hypothetical protein